MKHCGAEAGVLVTCNLRIWVTLTCGILIREIMERERGSAEFAPQGQVSSESIRLISVVAASGKMRRRLDSTSTGKRARSPCCI
ncbi:hypothetical protein NDN08_006721 [Rhodosorus marinus]|uniref:Uncharacterized protein n=1 Tax=Rhodosorus marinus TaxID=101924 RepID=A0AAV8UIK3_9RHOD|nr:hypothetical protein NDN08_006721 [Rhodosorus marinus]